MHTNLFPGKSAKKTARIMGVLYLVISKRSENFYKKIISFPKIQMNQIK